MPYDRALADRIRDELAPLPSVREQSMFGGLSFLVNGRIAVVADSHGKLMVRCDPARTEVLLGRDGAQPVRMGRRTMSDGWLQVTITGPELAGWIEEALAFNAQSD